MVRLEDLTEVYYAARRNKRRSRDACRFEINMESNLVRLWRDINGRTLDTRTNYAFVVTRPKPREIFATEIRVRIVHHYLDWRLRPIYEAVLSDRTFNNRNGKGLHAAVRTFHDDIRELSEGYTKDAWIVHMDLKGYFPNADVEIALAQQLDLIDRFYEGPDKDDLRYMMTVCMRADPARHCSVYVPRSDWDAIPPEKSLFNKPVGTGGAIGFLCWQNAMGVYINAVVKWLQEFDFLRVVVFVDDIYVVTTDKERFLAFMPEIRRRFAGLKVRMNERKFYCQHYSKGVHVLGTRIKFDREYADDALVARAFRKASWWKNSKSRTRDALRMLSSMNTYLSMMKTKAMREKVRKFTETVLADLGNYIEWNVAKSCFALKERYGFKAQLYRRYGNGGHF